MAPKSLTAAPMVPNGPVSLPLAKISYCTASNLRSNMRWNHLPNRDGMFAVFDTVRQRAIDGLVVERRMLKIISGSDQLVCTAHPQQEQETVD